MYGRGERGSLVVEVLDLILDLDKRRFTEGVFVLIGVCDVRIFFAVVVLLVNYRFKGF